MPHDILPVNLLQEYFAALARVTERTAAPQAPDARQSDEGLILLDRNRIVFFVNEVAAGFLKVQNDEFVGQLFNYFISTEETFMIGISRRNGRTGLGEMLVRKFDLHRETAYRISIRDVTETVLLEDGRRWGTG